MPLIPDPLARLFLAFWVLLPAGVIADQQNEALEEMTVTAQKREERTQDVPISMSILSIEELQQLNIFGFSETAALTLGVNFDAGLQSASIRFRGVGPGAFAVNAPQSVAIFVDQFAQAQIGAAFTTLFDTQRIEVLRGPQGTLYGQNAPVGVYNISTRKPDTQRFRAHVRGSYSLYDGDTDRATRDVRGAVNVPLVRHKLGWRLAGVARDADGFATMEHPDARNHATGGSRADAIRSRLLWRWGADSELIWNVNYQDITRHPASNNFDGQVPGTGGNNPVPPIHTQFEDREYWGDFRSEVQADLWDTSVHLVHDAPWARLNLLVHHQAFDTESDQNRRPYFGATNNFQLSLDYEISTVELRASGATDRLEYVAGLYLYDRPVSVDADLSFGNTPVLGVGEESNETWSVFGNANVHLLERWDLALGLRLDSNEISADYTTSLAGALDGALRDRSDYDHLSWSTKLRWYPHERLTAYLALDNAFKQGGYNPLVSIGTSVEGSLPLVAEVAGDNLRYDEEVSTAVELGIKGSALDDALRYAAAIFYQVFDDYQLTQPGSAPALNPLDDVFTNVITNADEVTTRGVEASANFALSRRWNWRTRIAYFDADINTWNRRFCRGGEGASPAQLYCPVSDEPLHNLPKWSANNQISYTRPWAAWRLYANLNWSWVSEVDDTQVTQQFREDKHRIDASIGGRSRDLGLDLRLWIKNLTDEDFNQDPGLQQNGDPTQPAAWRGRYTPGREVGLSIGYRF